VGHEKYMTNRRRLSGLLLSILLLVPAINSSASQEPRPRPPAITRPSVVSPPSNKAGTKSRELTSDTQRQTATAGVTVGLNFPGSTLFLDSNFIPPDTMGAVGPNHIVELINGRYSVYRKTDGQRVQTSTLDDFWTNAGVTFNPFTFDTRVLFDSFS